MTRLDLTSKKAPLEKPTVGPDGRPLWQSNGERQRYAQRMLEEVDKGAVFAAAGQVVFHRKLKAGEIGPDDSITPTQDEMVKVIEWADLSQLQLLRKIAESIDKEPLR
ncbi:MAG: hypothetical protein WAK55_31630 [Xanthobacteraceae bacterium]